MTAIVTTVLDGVGTLLKYGFWSGATVAGLGAGYLVLTKPQKDTFIPYFRGLIEKNKDKSTSIGQRFLSMGVSLAIEKTSKFEYKDYVFGMTVDVTLPDGKELHFYGVCQNWFLRDN